MKVLVIGGTGNISRGIVHAALIAGHEVSIFTRGANYDAPPEGVRHIVGDRKDRATFESKFSSERFDAVFDMISFTAEDAASALRAFRGRVEHFVHCSTVMTYGAPFPNNGVNIDESAPLQGSSEYGLGKIAADRLLLKAHAEEGFPVTVMKPSYTHGPGNPLYRQVGGSTRWLSRLREGKPILSAGDGLNYFQYLASKDAGFGFVGVLGKKHCIGETYNIVHPQPRTWDEWQRTAAAAMGVEAKLVHVSQDTLVALDKERFGGMAGCFGHHQVFRHEKLMRDVPEFNPRTPLVESMREVIEWMDRHSLIEQKDDSDLEDRIISAITDLPKRFHATTPA